MCKKNGLQFLESIFLSQIVAMRFLGEEFTQNVYVLVSVSAGVAVVAKAR